VAISAKIESEIATLSREERANFSDTLGLEEAGLDRLIRAGYQLLHPLPISPSARRKLAPGPLPGHQGAAGGAVIHTISKKLHSRETIAYALRCAAVKPARATAASCGSKARNTSSPTATDAFRFNT